jgi:hypothetical protein
MANFYRLSITETGSTLELVVELPEGLFEGKSLDSLEPQLAVIRD